MSIVQVNNFVYASLIKDSRRNYVYVKKRALIGASQVRIFLAKCFCICLNFSDAPLAIQLQSHR